MKKHSGRRERKARKRRKRGGFAMQDQYGMVTLKLGRKKFSETLCSSKTTLLLKKKFSGCVVDAEK